MKLERRPVFFTSIPKCGKNLIYSFYFELGLKRWNWGQTPAILHAAHFARWSNKQNYAFPEFGPVSEEVEQSSLNDVIAQLGSMAADTIAHHHFLPAPRLMSYVAKAGVSTVFVTRDPRDVLVSMLNFSRKRQLPIHVSAMVEPLTDEEALLLLIEGRDKLVPFATYFDAYHDWVSAPGVTVFRFEDMIGPRGGGALDRQDETCAKLAALAGFDAADPAVANAQAKMFNEQAGTFFRGQIGAWRDAFTAPVQRAYEEHAAWLGPRWGYPA